MKIVNLKGVVVLVIILAVVDAAFAFGLSPFVRGPIVAAINKNVDPEISIESFTVHPMLLSVSLKGVEARDPENSSERFFYADQASAQLDAVALLRKKLWVRKLEFKNVDLEVVRNADGSLNVTSLQSEEQTEGFEPEQSRLDRIKNLFSKDKRDWFSQAFERIKSRFDDKESKDKQESEVINVKELPDGSVVDFVSGEKVVFRIGSLRLNGGRIVLTSDGRKTPPIEDIDIDLKNYRFLKNGLSEVDSFRAAGVLKGKKDGTFESSMSSHANSIHLKLDADNVDMVGYDALFEDSLPVRFTDGFVSASADTKIYKDRLESAHEIKLESHQIVPRSKISVTSLTLGTVLELLSEIDPLELKFKIGGTPDKPSYEGLNEVVMDLVKDKMPNRTEAIKEKAAEKFGELKDKFGDFFKKGSS